MKIMKRLFCILLSLTIVASLCIPSFAADEPYKYTIRIYAGNQGTINGGDVAVYSDQVYGTTRVLSLRGVQEKNPNKYHAVGIREAGKDNSEIVQMITVTKDADYVVAYAIPGDTVKYTIRYVDEDGNKIADSEEFYGIKNGEVILTPLYIPGYSPIEPFMRETLSENEAENEFRYVYTANPGGGNNGGNGGNGGNGEGGEDEDPNNPNPPVIPDLVLPEIIIPTPVIPVVPSIDNDNSSDLENEDVNDNNNGNDADGENAANNGENEGEDTEEEDTAVSFTDIFDQDSPLAGMKKAVEYITQPGSPMAGWSAPAAVTTSVLIMLGIPALIVFLILFFKKKKDDEKDKKAKVK